MNEEARSLIPDWLLAQSENSQLKSHLVVIGETLNNNDIEFFNGQLDNCGIDHSVFTQTNKSIDFLVSISSRQALSFFSETINSNFLKHYDVALLSSKNRKKKLLVCDMDSTIVKSETLDEIAKHAGIGDQVSDITDKAMRGEIDFNDALNERVKLLTGMSISLLSDVANMTKFNKGAESLLTTAKLNGIRTVLVSGGFEPIVNRVAEKLGFDRYVCNRMKINNDLLNGEVELPIVNSETKLSVLNEECKKMNIIPEQACAIGDGANDLPMIKAVGLGISYYGKPVLRKATPYQINATDLESTLTMMGIVN